MTSRPEDRETVRVEGDGTEIEAARGEGVTAVLEEGERVGRVDHPWTATDFGGDKDGNTIGAELVEEGGQEVHGLEGMDAIHVCVVVVVECGNDKEDEVEEKTNLLRPFTSVKLIVNEECCE